MPGKISCVMLIGALIFIIVGAFIKGLILSKHKLFKLISIYRFE